MTPGETACTKWRRAPRAPEGNTNNGPWVLGRHSGTRLPLVLCREVRLTVSAFPPQKLMVTIKTIHFLLTHERGRIETALLPNAVPNRLTRRWLRHMAESPESAWRIRFYPPGDREYAWADVSPHSALSLTCNLTLPPSGPRHFPLRNSMGTSEYSRSSRTLFPGAARLRRRNSRVIEKLKSKAGMSFNI
jgi:hypothetical protein